VEIIVITLWFYAIVIVASAFATVLVARAIRADNRDVARYESFTEVAPLPEVRLRQAA
jgi:hypothetical protein